jgi:site-specific recombinase XerD
MPDSNSPLVGQVSPFLNRDQPTLADVLEKVETNTELKPGRRSQLCSSLRTIGKILGLPLDAIPAHKRWLRDRLAKAMPRQAGVSKKRFDNARSDLWRAHAVAGIGRSRRAYLAPLSPEWQALWDAIASDHLRWRLKRFMSFCSALGIKPEDVDETTFALFRTALDEEGWVDNVDRAFRSAINSWNTAVETVPRWPQRRVALPPRRRSGWTLPLKAFPATFQSDVAERRRVFSGRDYLADDGPMRTPKESTVDHREFQIRMAASALVHRGHPIENITSLAYLVEIDNFKDIIRFMIDRKGEPTEAIHGLASGLCAIAKHHVKVAPAHLEALRCICKKLDLDVEGLREKTRQRLLQFDDPENVGLLLDLPDRLVEAAKGRKNPRDKAAARLVEVAVAIEILCFTGLRVSELAGLDLERHLKWGRDEDGEVLHIQIRGGEFKSRKAIYHELRGESLELVRHLLEEYRPRLQARPGTALFPGRFDGHKSANNFGERIKRVIRQHTGLVVNVHLIRSIIGKLHLKRDPGDYVTVSRVLHNTLDTTTKSYTQHEAQTARDHYRKTVLEAKAAPRRVRWRRSRKSKKKDDKE